MYRFFYKNSDNSRVGFSEKSIRSEFGDVNIKVPRDCNDQYEPQIIKKYPKGPKGLGAIEQPIITLYTKDMSN